MPRRSQIFADSKSRPSFDKIALGLSILATGLKSGVCVNIVAFVNVKVSKSDELMLCARNVITPRSDDSRNHIVLSTKTKSSRVNVPDDSFIEYGFTTVVEKMPINNAPVKKGFAD